MNIQWPLFLLSIGLLLPPPRLSASLRKYLMKPRRDVNPSIHSLLLCWQNWADLIRACVGAYLLTELAIQISPEVKGAAMKGLIIEAVVLSCAVLVQTLRIGPGFQLIAPVFYLSGITVILAGYASGGFAVFAGWLFAVGGMKPAYQLPIMGVALAVAGYVLGLGLPLILNCGLILLPLLGAFLFRKQLLFVASDPWANSSSVSAKKPTANALSKSA